MLGDATEMGYQGESMVQGEECVPLDSRRCKGRMSEMGTNEDLSRRARRKLWIASIFCVIFMIAEVVGGIMANSLAVLTDAAHLLSDFAAFMISLFALWVATKEPTSRNTYGYHRAEILGALVSVVLIWVLTAGLVYEAIKRIISPEPVEGKLMFIVATLGLCVNVAMGFILMSSGHGHSHGLGDEHGHGHSHGGGAKKQKAISPHSHSHGHDHGHTHGGSGSGDTGYIAVTVSEDGAGAGASYQQGEATHLLEHIKEVEEEENINVRAAFIHVLGDGLQSVGVMIAAALIWYEPSWYIADPICTLVFAVIVLFTTVRLVRQSVAVLMEGTPANIAVEDVDSALLDIPGVKEVHDLHIWSLSVGKPSLSVHLLAKDEASRKGALAAATTMLADKFGILHTTIQVEVPEDRIPCATEDTYIHVSSEKAEAGAGEGEEEEGEGEEEEHGHSHGGGRGHEGKENGIRRAQEEHKGGAGGKKKKGGGKRQRKRTVSSGGHHHH